MSLRAQGILVYLAIAFLGVWPYLFVVRLAFGWSLANPLVQMPVAFVPAIGDGPRFAPSEVVESRAVGRQRSVLVRAGGYTGGEHWEKHEPTLEELALAYLRTASPAPVAPAAPSGGVAAA